MTNRADQLQAFDRLLTIMNELREKCPWDQKQTMETLRPLTIEETYELGDAILDKDLPEIKNELGDLLLHIVDISDPDCRQKEIEVKEYLENQPRNVISNIWKETLLSSMAMQLPMDLVKELETKPMIVNSIEEGEKIIMENINKGNLTGDPFFFRSFII